MIFADYNSSGGISPRLIALHLPAQLVAPVLRHGRRNNNNNNKRARE